MWEFWGVAWIILAFREFLSVFVVEKRCEVSIELFPKSGRKEEARTWSLATVLAEKDKKRRDNCE